MPASRREFTDLFRAVGGLLLASGVLALLIRKSGHHEWSKFARFLTAADGGRPVFARLGYRPAAGGEP